MFFKKNKISFIFKKALCFSIVYSKCCVWKNENENEYEKYLRKKNQLKY